MFTIANQAALERQRIAFHLAFFEQLGKKDENPLAQLFTTIPSTSDLEEWTWFGDLPDFEEWVGDRFLAGLEAFSLQLRNKNWASGLRLHQNDIKDGRAALVPSQIEALARKARTHRVRLMLKAIIAGMGTGAYATVSNGLAYDGQTFFSTLHATGSNKLTSALSLAALAEAEELLNSQTSFATAGADAAEIEPLDINGTHLIVGPGLYDLAVRLMGSEILLDGTGAAGVSNHMRNRYTVVKNPYLRGTYDDWWFLADLSQPIKPGLFQLREEITTSAVLGQQGGTNDSVPRFKSGDLWLGAEARYNVALWEYRTIVGSQVA